MSDEENNLRILRYNQERSKNVGKVLDNAITQGLAALQETDVLFRELEAMGLDVTAIETSVILDDKPQNNTTPTPIRHQTYEEILREAEVHSPGPVSVSDILTPEELAEVFQAYRDFERDFDLRHKMDATDYMFAGIVGTVAGLVDVVLVNETTSQKIKPILSMFGCPTNEINGISTGAKVSFDKVLESSFGAKGNHRANSQSHYPGILGLISGIRNILHGTSTHIVNGKVITIKNITKGFEKQIDKSILLHPSSPLPIRIMGAFFLVLKHWISDVNTSLGLPPPFMSVMQMITTGNISAFGEKNMSIAEFVTKIYHEGFDSRHFIGSCLTVTTNEVLIRLYFILRNLYKNQKNPDKLIPSDSNNKLQRILFIAHATTLTINAGKVYFTQNPLGVNLSQWTTFLRYLGPQVKWMLLGRDGLLEVEHTRNWTQKIRSSTQSLIELESQLSTIQKPIYL